MTQLVQDWIKAIDLPDMPTHEEVLSVLCNVLYKDTCVCFIPLDLLKLITTYLECTPKIRSMLDLPALLYHPQHPAKLVVSEGDPLTAYLHVWNEWNETYVRGFQSSFGPRPLTREEWDVVGYTHDFTGVLVDWIATEIVKDPVLYLGIQCTFLLSVEPVMRKNILLGAIKSSKNLLLSILS
jgi:hypothetical protein